MGEFGITMDEIKEATRAYFKRQREANKRQPQPFTQTNIKPLIPQPTPATEPVNNPQAPQPTTHQQFNNYYNNYPSPSKTVDKVKKEFSALKAGLLATISGGLGYYLYINSSAFMIKVNSFFGRISEQTEVMLEPQLVFAGIIGLGILLMAVGFCYRRQ